MFKKIIYASDFSKHSQAAFDTLLDMVKSGKPEVILVHIVSEKDLDMTSNMEGFSSPHLEELRETLRKHFMQDAEKRMTAMTRTLRDAGVDVEERIYEGVPHNEIVKIASVEEADLIVIGSHGKSALEEFFIGSTTEKILRKAPCPVLVVR